MKNLWGLVWQSRDQRDRSNGHLIRNEQCIPMLFTSRKSALTYANAGYGYLKTRKDLRTKPFFWRFPKAVKVLVSAKKVKGKKK